MAQRRSFLIGALALPLLTRTAPVLACEAEPRATVALQLVARHVLVTLLVDDQPATFMLDTGAERSLVTEAAVHRLGLALDQWVGTTVMGLGGYQRHQNAAPRSLSLGGVALRHELSRDSSMAVSPLPIAGFGDQLDGLLGRDFLSEFDLLLDIPARTLTLYKVRRCGADFMPLPRPAVAVPALPDYGKALVIPAGLDGHRLRVLLDSGAGTTLVTAPGMSRLGLTADALARDRSAMVRGIGRLPVPAHLHRFGSLDVGGQVSRNLVLLVAPVRVVPIVDLVLGIDWLQTRRVWLSYSTLRIFVAGA
ncbi:MAG TPA: retroviral-like aspartic protease family protein [Acetobacteraceae bacterium]|nr:retroviral-like aspartic protease family protein [Acetobacteraceae bacterium]